MSECGCEAWASEYLLATALALQSCDRVDGCSSWAFFIHGTQTTCQPAVRQVLRKPRDDSSFIRPATLAVGWAAGTHLTLRGF